MKFNTKSQAEDSLKQKLITLRELSELCGVSYHRVWSITQSKKYDINPKIEIGASENKLVNAYLTRFYTLDDVPKVKAIILAQDAAKTQKQETKKVAPPARNWFTQREVLEQLQITLGALSRLVSLGITKPATNGKETLYSKQNIAELKTFIAEEKAVKEYEQYQRVSNHICQQNNQVPKQ